MKRTITLDDWDLKILRRLVAESIGTCYADASFLKELLDEAEGITRQSGIMLVRTEGGGIAFKYNKGIDAARVPLTRNGSEIVAISS